MTSWEQEQAKSLGGPWAKASPFDNSVHGEVWGEVSEGSGLRWDLRVCFGKRAERKWILSLGKQPRQPGEEPPGSNVSPWKA